MSAAGTAAARVADLIRAARSVVALTGAGISVPSGIPDFRTPGTGLWHNVDPTEVAHIDVFHREPERFWRFYGDRFQHLEDKLPNVAHLALARLEQARLLDGVITQNIDRLHRLAGTRELVEVHGTIEYSSCLICGVRYPLSEVRELQRADPARIPRCVCTAPLKPDVVLFGEFLPAGALARAEQLALSADLMLCIGSSLEVHPVADLPSLTLAAGGQIVIITQGRTPMDREAAVRCEGDVVDEMRSVLSELGLAETPA